MFSLYSIKAAQYKTNLPSLLSIPENPLRYKKERMKIGLRLFTMYPLPSIYCLATLFYHFYARQDNKYYAHVLYLSI